MKILGTVLSKEHDITKAAFSSWRSSEGDPYSFYYLLVSVGVTKHQGSKQRRNRLPNIPCGLLHIYDISLNATRQLEIVTMFDYSDTLPIVIDIESLYRDDGPITKTNQESFNAFMSSLKEKSGKRGIPIVRANPSFLLSRFLQDDGTFPLWMHGVRLWVTGTDPVALPEYLGATLVYTGSDDIIVKEESSISIKNIKPAARKNLFHPFYARVDTGGLSAVLYTGPNDSDPKLGTIRNRTAIKIYDIQNDRAFLGDRMKRWISVRDFVRTDGVVSK